MLNPSPTRADLEFLLYNFLDTEALASRPEFEEHDRASFAAVLEASYRLAATHFATAAQTLDANEPCFNGQSVTNPPEQRAALDAYASAGFIGLGFSHGDGGLQVPFSITLASQVIISAADNPTAGYAFLTGAAGRVIAAFGTAEQRAAYLRPMVEGRFFGTMCLSESQAGSSLADVRTEAREIAAGDYRIRGSKMWISGGDHELSENIVHLVLARIQGAPPGVAGLSLFIVPKLRLDSAGRPAVRNDVVTVGLNHKMGHRATTNCALDFGAQDDCHGSLVGEPNEGLRYMFHMMNEARIGVGGGAAMTAYAAFQYATAYAKERRQGRPPDVRDASARPSLLIEHADVRRMLLAQKVIAEGGLALCLYCARLVDEEKTAPSAEARAEAGALLEVLTPIAKSWPSERGPKANSLAIQVLGGSGYVRAHPLERWYRDQRLNAIHEGTTGIQANDLLGRKVARNNGLAPLLRLIVDDAEKSFGCPDTAEMARRLRQAAGLVETVTRDLVDDMSRDRTAVLADAVPYLEMVGDLVIGWIWLLQARASAGADPVLRAGKLAAARYFFRYDYPRIEHRAHILSQRDDSFLTLCADAL